MAHVRRPTYTQPIPAHATRKGDTVRWKARGGAVKVGTVCPDNPARCLVEAECYYVFYTDHDGIARKKKGYPDKLATEQLAARLVQEAVRIHAGVLPPEAARPRRSMAELLDLWEKTLAAGGTAKHARTERLRAERVVKAAGAALPSQLTPAGVVRAVAAIRAAEGINGQTAAHHVKAVKGFTRWLWRKEKVEPVDHLAGLERRQDETDPRHERRALTPAEFARLVAAARGSAAAVLGLTGPERAALYVTAASTGFRSSELASLTVGAVAEAADATLAAADAKNRRKDTIPLSADVLAELGPLVAGRAAGEKVWPERTGNEWDVWWTKSARVIRHDLAAAGIPYADAAGRVYDFHALRGQLATDLMRAGVPQRMAQRIMRHSTPHLTAKYYQRTETEEMREAVNKLRKT